MTYIDILLISLLLFTLHYCRLLLTRLNTMQINNAKFELINNELVKSINLVETNIRNLKQASEQAQKSINDTVVQAQATMQKSLQINSVNNKIDVDEHNNAEVEDNSSQLDNTTIKNDKYKEISDILARFEASSNKHSQ